MTPASPAPPRMTSTEYNTVAPIRLVLVDDHPLVTEALSQVLGAEPRYEVVGRAARAGAALELIRATEPDVAVLDVRLPEVSGIELCAAIAGSMPAPACLMLTAYDDPDSVRTAVRAGASGFVLKSASLAQLTDSIDRVAAGLPAFDAEMTARLIDDLRNPEPRVVSPLERLNDTERAVLQHLSDGLTNREIGARVHLAESTVKAHVSTILRKLGVTTRTEAAVLAMRLGHPDR